MMKHNINEGFYKNVSIDPRETTAIKLLNYYDNMAKYAEDQLKSADKFIRDATGGKLPNNYNNTVFALPTVINRLSKDYKQQADRLRNSMMNGELDNYIGDHFMKVINKDPNNIFITDVYKRTITVNGQAILLLSPETIGGDPNNLNHLNKIFNFSNTITHVDVLVILYGFRNLKEFDVKSVFGIDRSNSFGLSLYVIDCPKLADSNNINIRNNIPQSKGKYKNELNLIFFPDKTSTYTPLQIMRKLHIVDISIGAVNYFYPKRKTGTEFIGGTNDDPTPKISKSSPASTATPVSVSSSGEKVDDLPLLIKKDKNLIYTIDGTEPIGRITRDGKHIYKGTGATIWFIVGDDHICRTKKGVALYRLG